MWLFNFATAAVKSPKTFPEFQRDMNKAALDKLFEKDSIGFINITELNYNQAQLREDSFRDFVRAHLASEGYGLTQRQEQDWLNHFDPFFARKNRPFDEYLSDLSASKLADLYKKGFLSRMAERRPVPMVPAVVTVPAAAKPLKLSQLAAAGAGWAMAALAGLGFAVAGHGDAVAAAAGAVLAAVGAGVSLVYGLDYRRITTAKELVSRRAGTGAEGDVVAYGADVLEVSPSLGGKARGRPRPPMTVMSV